MFRREKAFADAARVRFARHRATMKPREGRVSFRNVPGGTFPRNASHFGIAAPKNSVALLGKNTLKNLLKVKLGVTTVTGNGIDILTGLIDAGVEDALEVCENIHNNAVMRGASKKIFGTDHHVAVTREGGFMDHAPKIGGDVIGKRDNIANTSRARFNAMPPEKKAKKLAYQYLPASTKTIYNRLSKCAKLLGAGATSINMSPRQIIEMVRARGGDELLKEKLGLKVLEPLYEIEVPFLDAAGNTFLPTGRLLAGISEEKWMNMETVAMMIGILDYDGVLTLFDTHRRGVDEAHTGFYRKWKLLDKDMKTFEEGRLDETKKKALVRAMFKGFVVGTVASALDVRGDRVGVRLDYARYLNQLIAFDDRLKRGDMAKTGAEIFYHRVRDAMPKFEKLYHNE